MSRVPNRNLAWDMEGHDSFIAISVEGPVRGECIEENCAKPRASFAFLPITFVDYVYRVCAIEHFRIDIDLSSLAMSDGIND